jgi:hypothetical protein
MALDVESPEPPSLSGPGSRNGYAAVDATEEDAGDDYRRGELEGFLREGAWEDGFGEWAATTSLSVEQFRTARGLGLVARLDFYWDPASDEVGYAAPAVPEEADVGSEDRNEIDAELDTLGRVVSEVIENDYLFRDGAEFGFFESDEGEGEGEGER